MYLQVRNTTYAWARRQKINLNPQHGDDRPKKVTWQWPRAENNQKKNSTSTPKLKFNLNVLWHKTQQKALRRSEGDLPRVPRFQPTPLKPGHGSRRQLEFLSISSRSRGARQVARMPLASISAKKPHKNDLRGSLMVTWLPNQISPLLYNHVYNQPTVWWS